MWYILSTVTKTTNKHTHKNVQFKSCKLSFILVLLRSSSFQVGSVVKNPPATQETWVQSLAQQYPLEKEMAAPTLVFLPWKSHKEESDGLQSMGWQRVRHYLATKQQQSIHSFPSNECIMFNQSLVAQLVMNLPAMRETGVLSLG